MTKRFRGTCDKCNHIADGCDEDCRCCGECYMKTGKEVCNKTCECVKHIDDGGFFVDGNHPDAMYDVK